MSAPIPDDAPWSAGRFAVVDLEGNGHRPPDLVELAVVPIDAGRPGPAQTWLVRPDEKITREVFRIHGIRNADVANSPRFDDIRGEVVASLEGRYVVAHNAIVDWNVLHRKLPAYHPPGVLDTLRLARALYPGRQSYKLSALLDALDLHDNLRGLDGGLHRAAYDATATLHLFLHLAARSSRGPLLLQQLLVLSGLPATVEDNQRSLF